MNFGDMMLDPATLDDFPIYSYKEIFEFESIDETLQRLLRLYNEFLEEGRYTKTIGIYKAILVLKTMSYKK